MRENNYTTKLRASFDTYKLKSEREITELNKKVESVTQKMAFYMFEYNLVRGTLPKNIKEIYDLNNKDSQRLNKIMNLINTVLTFKELPGEIKLVIKEMIV